MCFDVNSPEVSPEFSVKEIEFQEEKDFERYLDSSLDFNSCRLSCRGKFRRRILTLDYFVVQEFAT